MQNPSSLVRVAVYIDGGYFQAVSDFHRYAHDRAARLSIEGVLAFVRSRLAAEENVQPRRVKIVDAHYFRSRLSFDTVLERNKLEHERRFEDVLIRAGVTAHHMLRTSGFDEKGIEVWLALEAFDLAAARNHDVVVLLVSDGDYVPLVRKLSKLGVRVMVLAWDFRYVDDTGYERETRTSQALLGEATYVVRMNELIDSAPRGTDPVIDGIFHVPKAPLSAPVVNPEEIQSLTGSRRAGTINTLRDGYGFITDAEDPTKSWFFHYSGVIEVSFDELRKGEPVEFELVEGPRGLQATGIHRPWTGNAI